MQQLKIYNLFIKIFVLLLPLYFVGFNLAGIKVSISFIPLLYIVFYGILNEWNRNFSIYTLVNIIFLFISFFIYDEFNYNSYLFFFFFSFLFFIKPIIIQTKFLPYLILAPFLLYIIDSIVPFVVQSSFIEKHGSSYDRFKLIYSEPSMMAIYFFTLMIYFKDFIILNKKYLIILSCIIISSQSLVGMVMLFLFLFFEFFENYRKSVIILGIPVLYILFLILPDAILTRLTILISMDYIGKDFATSIGNRINSFFFIFDYMKSSDFSWFGQGWNIKYSYINKTYGFYEFTDLGNGNVKNIITHFFYFIGVFGLIIFSLIFKVFLKSFKSITFFIVFCFAYNWHTHPFFYFFIIGLLNYQTEFNENNIIK